MRKVSVSALCVAVALALAAAPGSAQPTLNENSLGYRLSPAKHAARELADYARCLVSRRYDRARSVVLAPYESAEQAEAANRVVQSGPDPCLQAGFTQMQLIMRTDALVGGLAQALVLRDYPNLATLVDGSSVDVAAELERAAPLTTTERFGRCIVWRDPAGVYALLSTGPFSSDERQAIEALKEDMGYCIAEGATLKINETFLRNVTGIAAYRLAHQLSSRPQGAAVDGAGKARRAHG